MKAAIVLQLYLYAHFFCYSYSCYYLGGPPPSNSDYRDHKDYIRGVLVYSFLYHYYMMGGPELALHLL